MRGMPTSNKIKANRKREESAIRNRLDLSSPVSEDYGSYHSHHHLSGEIPDPLKTAEWPDQKPETTRDSPDHVGLAASVCGNRYVTPKFVVFSSKAGSDTQSQNSSKETYQNQSTAAQAHAQDKLQKFGAKRKSVCSSKLVQTCSSISDKKVSCHSIAVGVSNIDYFQEKRCEKDQSRCVSRRALYRWNSSAASGKFQPPGSSMTLSSVPYSRTESSIVAALEAPPASYRHAHCMAAHYYSSTEEKYSPVNYIKKKTKKPKEPAKQRNSTPTKGTVKRKLPHGRTKPNISS